MPAMKDRNMIKAVFVIMSWSCSLKNIKERVVKLMAGFNPECDQQPPVAANIINNRSKSGSRQPHELMEQPE